MTVNELFDGSTFHELKSTDISAALACGFAVHYPAKAISTLIRASGQIGRIAGINGGAVIEKRQRASRTPIICQWGKLWIDRMIGDQFRSDWCCSPETYPLPS